MRWFIWLFFLLPATCLAVSPAEKIIIYGAYNAPVFQWDFTSATAPSWLVTSGAANGTRLNSSGNLVARPQLRDMTMTQLR